MELRTTFNIPESEQKISYSDPVMFIGSCFATSIGQKFQQGKMPVIINPAGTVYNPVSVCTTIESLASRKHYDETDLYCHEGTWISFDHYTDFSSADRNKVLEKINKRTEEAFIFLSGARFLFITFGTARIFRWRETGKIVSNCHKIPASCFSHDLLTVDEIINLWYDQLDKLKNLNPALKVVFTISPVRHWKDGAHGNQVSKSTLFLAVEKLLEHSTGPAYFPAYELVMDDLRDYRFYDDDMLHLSTVAIDYIWDAFCRCYLDRSTLNLWQEVMKITKAVFHRIEDSNSSNTRVFAENMIKRIESILSRNPHLNLEYEKKYFQEIVKNLS